MEDDEGKTAGRTKRKKAGSGEDDKPVEIPAPRRYQLEILGRAEKENVIACLGTGTGKTLIAVMLMQSRVQFLRVPGAKKIFIFLVPSVPLASQQKDVIEMYTDLRVKELVSGKIDSFDRSSWQRESTENEVLVMTPQILLNSLHHSLLDLEMVDLLVFDECHHAHKDHPYALIMRDFYARMDPGKRPKIFGMTASPVENKGVKSREDCAEQFYSLESTMDAKLVTVPNMEDVDEVIPSAEEMLCPYEPSRPLPITEQILVELHNIHTKMQTDWMQRNSVRSQMSSGYHQESSISRRGVEWLAEVEIQRITKRVSREWLSLDFCLRELGQYCAFWASVMLLSDAAAVELDDSVENIELQSAVLSSRTQFLEQARDLLSCQLPAGIVGEGLPSDPATALKQDAGTVEARLREAVQQGLLTPKVEVLVMEILRKRMTAAGEKFHCIVFAERVVVVHVLANVLNELLAGIVKSGVLTGKQSRSLRAVTNKRQADTLEAFREGELNLLVATDVAEEGLDIQQCNAVVRFDLNKTVKSYIQSKGRARARDSTYLILAERGSLEHEELLKCFLQSEEYMRQEILQRTRVECVEESDEVIEEYRVESTGAVADIHDSIQLLHYYCVKLPSDSYCTPQPEFHEAEAEGGFTVEIRLPCNAPVQAQIVKGPPRRNMVKAKQVACLKVIRILHQVGGLTDSLLPNVGDVDSDFEDGGRKGRLGTRKHRVEVKEKVPEVWRVSGDTSAPSAAGKGVHCFVYSIRFTFQGEQAKKSWHTEEISSMALLTERQLDTEAASLVVPLSLAHGGAAKAELAHCGSTILDLQQLQWSKAFHTKLLCDTLPRCTKCALSSTPMSTPKRLQVGHQSLMATLQPGDANLWDTERHYLFLPLAGKEPLSNVSVDIDWPLVHSVIHFGALMEENQTPIVASAIDGHAEETKLSSDAGPQAYSCNSFSEEVAEGGGSLNGRAGKAQLAGCHGLVGSHGIYGLTQSTGGGDEKQLPMSSAWLMMADGKMRKDALNDVVVKGVHNGWQYLVKGIREDLDAESKFPDDIANTYEEYLLLRHEQPLLYKKQPLLSLRQVPKASNFLVLKSQNTGSKSVLKGKLNERRDCVELPPELCRVIMPGRVFRAAQILPSVMHRLEGMLLACQLRDKIAHEVGDQRLKAMKASKVLEALTSGSCNDVISLERLELLGDAYLKWAVSCHLFRERPDDHEGLLTRSRSRLTCNKTLYQLACGRGLEGYLRARQLVTTHWQAPGIPLHVENCPHLYCCRSRVGEKGRLDANMANKANFVKSGHKSASMDLTNCPETWDSRVTCEEDDSVQSDEGDDDREDISDEDNEEEVDPAGTLRGVDELVDDMWQTLFMGEGKREGNRGVDSIDEKGMSGPQDMHPPTKESCHEAEANHVGLGSVVVSSKSIADMAEALIGVYWEEMAPQMGLQGGLKIIEWLGIPVELAVTGVDDDGGLDEAGKGCKTNERLEALEQVLGYTFQRKELLMEALTHASFQSPHGHVKCYQRLEFLGDAVLDFLVTRQLKASHPGLSPGTLTLLRSAAVNNENFARIAMKPHLQLHLYLRHQSETLQRHIGEFAQALQQPRSSQDGPHSHNFGKGDVPAPKVLGDLVESLAGAIFVDSQFDVELVWEKMKPLLEPLPTPQNIRRHPISLLTEFCQARGLERPQFRASPVDDGRVPHWRVQLELGGFVLAELFHKQKTAAKKRLAATVLAELLQRERELPKSSKGKLATHTLPTNLELLTKGQSLGGSTHARLAAPSGNGAVSGMESDQLDDWLGTAGVQLKDLPKESRTLAKEGSGVSGRDMRRPQGPQAARVPPSVPLRQVKVTAVETVPRQGPTGQAPDQAPLVQDPWNGDPFVQFSSLVSPCNLPSPVNVSPAQVAPCLPFMQEFPSHPANMVGQRAHRYNNVEQASDAQIPSINLHRTQSASLQPAPLQREQSSKTVPFIQETARAPGGVCHMSLPEGGGQHSAYPGALNGQGPLARNPQVDQTALHKLLKSVRVVAAGPASTPRSYAVRDEAFSEAPAPVGVLSSPEVSHRRGQQESTPPEELPAKDKASARDLVGPFLQNSGIVELNTVPPMKNQAGAVFSQDDHLPLEDRGMGNWTVGYYANQPAADVEMLSTAADFYHGHTPPDGAGPHLQHPQVPVQEALQSTRSTVVGLESAPDWSSGWGQEPSEGRSLEMGTGVQQPTVERSSLAGLSGGEDSGPGSRDHPQRSKSRLPMFNQLDNQPSSGEPQAFWFHRPSLSGGGGFSDHSFQPQVQKTSPSVQPWRAQSHVSVSAARLEQMDSVAQVLWNANQNGTPQLSRPTGTAIMRARQMSFIVDLTQPVSSLMELCQSRHWRVDFQVVGARGVDHQPTFVIEATVDIPRWAGPTETLVRVRGEGGNKKEAKKCAAKEALLELSERELM